MYQGNSILALIPARGGSKGLPGKNIRPLCGRPLIEWSILRALESKHVDCVCVTTDSEEIAAISRAAGAEVPFLRPKELSTDKSPTIDCVEHALDFYERQQGRRFDWLALMEATSPLRHPGDIDAMLEKVIERSDGADAIVSIGRIGEHPSIVRRKNGEMLAPFCPDMPMPSRRQDQDPAYFPYCVAYIVKVSTLRSERSFYPQRTMWYEIRRYQNYEIDDIQDFLCVEAIMKNEWSM